MTLVAIAYADKWGRKPLLYVGLWGMLISLITLGSSFAWAQELGSAGKWIAVASVVVYIASFAMSLGPVCWIMISEIMPLQIRGLAMSAATVSNFGFNFISGLTGFAPVKCRPANASGTITHIFIGNLGGCTIGENQCFDIFSGEQQMVGFL